MQPLWKICLQGNSLIISELLYFCKQIGHLSSFNAEYSIIKGNIKIWTSGYSRGGAVVNISAGRIDDGLVKYKNILSDEINYTKDDIYAYAFEAPAGKIIKNEDTLRSLLYTKCTNFHTIGAP